MDDKWQPCFSRLGTCVRDICKQCRPSSELHSAVSDQGIQCLLTGILYAKYSKASEKFSILNLSARYLEKYLT